MELVKLVWTLVTANRGKVEGVLDLGAGDARFATHGRFLRYDGWELDGTKIPSAEKLPLGATVHHRCVLEAGSSADCIVGNPPYIRSQDLALRWRERASKRIQELVSVYPDGRSNAYLYFAWLAVGLCTPDGLIALVLPLDWIVRPSAAGFREFLTSQGWSVKVYELAGTQELFPEVKTSATVTLIDKSKRGNGIEVFSAVQDSDSAWRIGDRPKNPSFLPFEKASHELRASRGFSSGSQRTFLLTEEEREGAGISRRHCQRAVASLRGISSSLADLDLGAFEQNYVRAGRRCWLLKTWLDPLPSSLVDWLELTPKAIRMNRTCASREDWRVFSRPATPDILYGSGFRGARPPFLANSAGAVHVGSVHGIVGVKDLVEQGRLLRYLRSLSLERQVLEHARGLLKLEVRQVNGLLNRFAERR